MPTTTKSPRWSPRSSSLGPYMTCDQRAAFDRAIHEGLIEAPENCRSTAYADYGTCAHFLLQKRVDAVFLSPEEPPTPAQRASAATLFKGNEADMDAMLDRLTAFAARELPPAPDGKPWLAEAAFKQADLSGHIDFLSQDRSMILDLKTTSRKPNHGRIKPSHLYQILAYRKLVAKSRKGVAPERAAILYIDSLRASWASLMWIDLTTPDILELAGHLDSQIRYLRGARLYREARPRLGLHCETDFCPHTAACRDLYIPPSAAFVENAPTSALPTSFVSPLDL